MQTSTRFLSRLLGLYCVVTAVAMLIRGVVFVDMVEQMTQDAALLFLLGVFTVFAGLAMVLTHNLWSGGILTVSITVTGWLALLKGVMFMVLTPQQQTGLYLNAMHYRDGFYGYALFTLVLGLAFCYGGFSKRYSIN